MELIQELSLNEILCEFELVAEDFAWDVGQPLEAQLADASNRLMAARRALGIANKLTDPASRKKHRSRIMGMLNRLGHSLVRLQQAIAGETEAMSQDRDQEWDGVPRE